MAVHTTVLEISIVQYDCFTKAAKITLIYTHVPPGDMARSNLSIYEEGINVLRSDPGGDGLKAGPPDIFSFGR
jgi:hypothetical protein